MHPRRSTLAVLLGLLSFLPASAGTPPAFVWSGNGETPSIVDSGNWTDGTPEGTGSENLTFGDIATEANRTITIPDLEESYIAVNDLLFNGSSPLNYTFAGTAGSPLLFLQGSLTLSNTGTVTFADSLSLRLSYGNHDVTLAEGATLVVESIVGGDDDGGSLSKYGASTLELHAANTFGNGLSLHEGTLLVSRSSTYEESEISNGPVGHGTLKLYNDTILTTPTSDTVTLHNDVDLDSLEGEVTLDVPNYSRLELAGYITGAASLLKTGSGELVLSNDSSEFEGGVTVQQGTLLLGASSDSEGEDIWGPLGSGTLSLNGETTLGVAAADTYTLHNDVELDANAEAGVTFHLQSAASLNLVGALSGQASLVKTGAGALTLSGSAGDFAGNTTINGGTLTLDEVSLYAGTTTVNSGGTLTLKNNPYVNNTTTVNSGGKLTGNGRLYEGIIGAGATLAPGFSGLGGRIGDLTFYELTLKEDSILEIDVKHLGAGELSFDRITVEADATLTIQANAENPLTLKLISLNSDGVQGDLAAGLEVGTLYSLNFLTYNTTRVGDLELGVNVVLDTSDFSGDAPSAVFGLVRDGNAYSLTFTPVPEPSTYALMLLGLAAIGLTVRRQRRRAS